MTNGPIHIHTATNGSEHVWGPWRRVDANGDPPVSRDDSAWAAHRRGCSCGASQHRNKKDEE